ncbi:sulfurtransferase [Cytophagales bacterium LB-30]|uniref:Sulfurtransferase n=1 Tax=Shiella aurantiaca TaxID=3058365 RepID=A0ABT8F656_9BACT|nr:sulfurtransferase [Shiella aurantiaca]MDN4165859.1 sulfurtransferase [Shiella aurantiaca]
MMNKRFWVESLSKEEKKSYISFSLRLDSRILIPNTSTMPTLVTPEWLHAQRNHPDLVILDASLKENISGLKPPYEGVQIPGARYFDLEKHFSDHSSGLPHTLPSEKDFEAAAQALGINQDSLIVVYDYIGIYTSPRAWWMFHIMGHTKVHVLNGGLPAWVEAGFPTEEIQSHAFASGNFRAKLDAEKVKNLAFVQANLSKKEALVIDARSAGRFTAEVPEPRQGLRGGHIPGSYNIPFMQVLEKGKYKSAEELKSIFSPYLNQEKPLVFSCGSGVTACVLYLALEQITDGPKAVFDGSWTEWALNPNVPVETGQNLI